MARPKTKFHKQEICRLLALGEPIQKILMERVESEDGGWVELQRPDMPAWEEVVGWLKADEVFLADYEQARVFGADYLADRMIQLVDELRTDPKRAPAVKAAMEILKWQTMVRNSKYSERTIQETKTTGPMDQQKVQAEIKRIERELKIVK